MDQPNNPKLDFPNRPGANLYGVYPAIVLDIKDPENQGRVRVRVPALKAQAVDLGVWARLATLMAGNAYGTWFIPDVGNEVLVVFEGGDARHPYVIGSLWNGQDAPPESIDSTGNNFIKAIRSRNGVRLAIDDTSGQEAFTVETPGGQKITLKDGPGSVEISDSNGNSIKLETSGVTVTASGKVTINASTVEISAGVVNVNAGISRFSGVVQADTVITNSVISASYSPGAGNIW